MLDAAVTFRDGIGVDDLTWLAGLISVIAVIVGAVWASGIASALLGNVPRLLF